MTILYHNMAHCPPYTVMYKGFVRFIPEEVKIDKKPLTLETFI